MLFPRNPSAALCAATLLLVSPVNAQPRNTPAEQASARLSLAGLDLTSEAGRQAAQARVTRLARQLCNRFRDSRVAEAHLNDAACLAESVRTTMAAIDARIAGTEPSAITAQR